MSSAPEQSKRGIDKKRLFFILLGIALFCLIYYSTPWADAVDPAGKHFGLTREGKASIAMFLFAATWWIFEVIPIGVTSVLICVTQALFLIRPTDAAFTDFMDPSVWFIFGSIAIGQVFTKTGLTQRMAYRMLMIVGERTSMIYLGCFVMVAMMTLIMAHTAVAATVFPLLVAINSLYGENDKPTNFGKGLFIGMAFTAGAGSIITLLGAARGAVAIGFFKNMTGKEITFFEFTYYLFPIGALMVILLWILLMFKHRPEKKEIPGLRPRASALYAKLGPITSKEIAVLAIVLSVVAALSLRSFIPALQAVNKSAIMLVTTLLFFLFNILHLKDLEEVPWNIILLFGGAMSMGLCLWQTGAAGWLAVKWFLLFQNAHWFIFVMGIAFFVLIMTNFIMNVAAIAISLPVALAIAPYLGVAPEVVLFSSLVTAGMPFMLLIGAAPNAIAYGSSQFSAKEFFMSGLLASLLLMAVLGIFIAVIWPFMGMPVLIR